MKALYLERKCTGPSLDPGSSSSLFLSQLDLGNRFESKSHAVLALVQKSSLSALAHKGLLNGVRCVDTGIYTSR